MIWLVDNFDLDGFCTWDHDLVMWNKSMDASFGQLPINCEWFMAKYSIDPHFNMVALYVLEIATFHIDLPYMAAWIYG